MVLLARLSRIVPLLIILAVVAGIIYLVATWRYSPTRAKEILISLFTRFTGVLSIVLALGCIYALLDGNPAVFEMVALFLATALVALGITRICHAVFIRNHPNWKKKPEKAETIDDKGRKRPNRFWPFGRK